MVAGEVNSTSATQTPAAQAMTPEAATCREYVVPKLKAAGWEAGQHAIAEQLTFTDGRILVRGVRAHREEKKRADYVLRYTPDVPLAVVEAKAHYAIPAKGLQQAKEYAEMLGLHFAYATNGLGIVEHDYFTGMEAEMSGFPTPDELWTRYRAGRGLADEATAQRVLTPGNTTSGRLPRYYQQIAIQRAVEAILKGQTRLLLTLATGTGKTEVAFQICWKLTQARWNRAGAARKPRILYLADRKVLVDDPKDKTFAAFGEARWKIAGRAVKSREMYFSTYQAIAEDERRPGLYKEYAPDFFDLIIVDECHRGSARRDSVWREILLYFKPAAQLGMTATPKREESADTYAYFENPLYTYSLKQGIEDGFLAPYRVHRVVTDYDAHGWRPSPGDLDRFKRPIPDDEYQTRDFERAVALRARTKAIARHLTDYLRQTNRFAKTMVFCVDQDHAAEMRFQLSNLNADLVKRYPDYVCRVTADEGQIGAGHLSHFQDLESTTPVILTTSQLLTTGVDAPTCKNVVLARVVGSMVEFKQIIGRGTRVREDYDKLYFTILDYTGSATRLFADPDFDGEPALATEEEIDAEGRLVPGTKETEIREATVAGQPDGVDGQDGSAAQPVQPALIVVAPPRKYFFDGGSVAIVAEQVQELAPDGSLLRTVRLTDYTAQNVRTLFPTEDDLRGGWSDPRQRGEIVQRLAARGVDFAKLAATLNEPDADPFDLLCHLAFNGPLRTRRERAERVRRQELDFFRRYGPEARAVLNELLDKYAVDAAPAFAFADALQVPPISKRGNLVEIADLFGGAAQLQQAVTQLQNYLYAN